MSRSAAAYADDGHVCKVSSISRSTLKASLKHASKVDLGMEHTSHKCKVLVPGLSQD